MQNFRVREVISLLQQITHRKSDDLVSLALEARDAVVSKRLRSRLLDFAERPAYYEDDEVFMDLLIRDLKLEL